MKKLCLLAVILISTFATAQIDKKENQKIIIADAIEIPAVVTSYRGKLDLSLQEARYSNPNSFENFSQMKETLLQKILETGIKKSQITENKAAYYSTGRGNEGTTFEFISSNEDEMAKFLSTSIPGATARTIEFQLSYDDSLFEDKISKAIAEMKKRAEIIARGLGLKISKVSEVNLSQYRQSQGWISYKENNNVNISIEYILE